MEALRLMVYDRTCTGWPWGLSWFWRGGGSLYGLLGRFDGSRGVGSWDEAFSWLSSFGVPSRVGEVQFWGHGRWGRALIDGQSLDRGALKDHHRLRPRLEALRERLTPRSLWWFRTCETLGARSGQAFARAWSDFWGCPVAGHTYIIAYYQSGLHLLQPGMSPHWGEGEGLRRGTGEQPLQALPSRPWEPNTITCLQGRVPEGY